MMSDQHKHVVYVPPKQEELHKYAKNVCKALAERVNPAFARPEVERGFTEFVELMVNIYTKHLNSESSDQGV